MNSGKNVFRQLLQFLPRHDFNLCVRRYRGEHWAKSFTTFDQFLCLAYAQITGRESLRDIETCLNSHRDKLYHVGFRGSVSRTTLADANERRDYRIFQDFGHVLIGIAQGLYRDDPLAIELKQPLYAFDSTTLDLCLSLFPWAEFRRTKAAVKMHTLIDLRGSIPTFVAVTTGKVHMSGCSMRCRSAKTPYTRWIAAMSTSLGCTPYINRCLLRHSAGGGLARANPRTRGGGARAAAGHGIRERRRVCGGWHAGLAGKAPYDAIVVSAAAPHIPQPLTDQLADGGRMVIPVGGASGQNLVLVERKGARSGRGASAGACSSG